MYVDNELQGLKIDEQNTEKLYLKSVFTQTDSMVEQYDSPFEEKYKKLLIKFKLLHRKYKISKSKNKNKKKIDVKK